MAVGGIWNLTVNSPMGAQKSTITLASDGDALIETAKDPNEFNEIIDGKVSGGEVAWKVAVSQPFPITLEFSGVVDGDKISGTVKAGSFGSFGF